MSEIERTEYDITIKRRDWSLASGVSAVGTMSFTDTILYKQQIAEEILDRCLDEFVLVVNQKIKELRKAGEQYQEAKEAISKEIR